MKPLEANNGGAPAGAKTETPTWAKAETPAGVKAKTHGGAKVKTPAETPFKTSSKTPAKTPAVSRLYLKFRSRLTTYFLLLVALPFLAALAASYFNARSQVVQKAHEAAFTNISRETQFIRIRIGELESSIAAAAVSIDAAEIARILRYSSAEARTSAFSEIIREHLSPSQAEKLSAAYLAAKGGIMVSCGPDAARASISGPSSQKWFNDAVRNPDSVVILGMVQRFYDEGASKVVLGAAKALKADNIRDYPAVILLDFNQGILTDFIRPLDESGSERLIIDYDGHILYCKNTGKLTTADSTLRDATAGSSAGTGRIFYNNNDYYMTYSKYPELKWIFIELTPTSNITGRIFAHNLLPAACFMLLPFALAVYLRISLRLIRPFNELTSVITDFENQFSGGSAARILPALHKKEDGADPAGASDIESLINKIYSIRLSQKEAELNSLQNQINPHFLYNTLESIRGAALYHGIHDIAAMSKALSLLFRYSISERMLVTVKEELQHLENYMSIQNFRYENKFDLLYSIPPDLMNCKILKLTLQPLIENSIKHGLETKLGRGTIRIEIMELDNNIKIQVSDDGLGMPPRKIEELNRALAAGKYQPGAEGDRTGTGIGVANVNSRIKLYFGGQYGLKFREAPVGTTVEITLPAVKDA